MIQSIKSKIIAAGVAILVLSGATAAGGLWTATTLDLALHRLEASSQAVREETQADMMHDAIRGDVLSAVVFGSTASGAKSEISGHVAELRRALASSDRLTTDPASRKAIEGLGTVLDNYTGEGEKIVALARTDPKAAAARLPAFNAAFTQLEGQLSLAGDDLQAASAYATGAANGQATWAKGLMIGALVLGLATSAGLILAGLTQVVRPLLALTQTVKSMSEGKADVTLSGAERQDELGSISRAILALQDLIIARMQEASKGAADAAAIIAAAKLSQAVVEFDLSGAIIDANDKFLQATGYALSDVVGRHHSMFVDRDYAASPEYGDFWRRLNAGEAITDKFTRLGRDDAKIIIEASYSPILGLDGKPYKIVKFAADITATETERARVQALQEAVAAEQSIVVNETAAGLSALAAGDLAHRITTAFPGDYARLQTDFNSAMGKLEEAMGVIGANASAMQSGAGEISQAADDLSRRTEQQAATLEETAAALDEITATVKRTAEGAERAGAVVTGAKTAAENSGVVVGRAVAAMGEIERSSDQISQIIGVIDEIAFQTNLLALNAGVEAARAGDAGRGFAVVASEVRALAQRSAEAAKEIKSLIAASSGHVKDGVGLVGETGQALTAIVERVSEINGLMAEITASAQEQATALSQVNTAVNQMDQTTQQNAAMVEQSTAASHNLSQEAEELAVLVGKFHVSDDGRGAARSSRTKPNPVRQAQSRIADFARQSAPAPARRAAGGGAALAQSSEPQWEQF